MRSFVRDLSLALCIYGFAAWLYVAAVALFQPRTLPWQLTHLASWPRTDTFGEVSFAVSFGSFLVFRALGQTPAGGRAEEEE